MSDTKMQSVVAQLPVLSAEGLSLVVFSFRPHFSSDITVAVRWFPTRHLGNSSFKYA